MRGAHMLTAGRSTFFSLSVQSAHLVSTCFPLMFSCYDRGPFYQPATNLVIFRSRVIVSHDSTIAIDTSRVESRKRIRAKHNQGQSDKPSGRRYARRKTAGKWRCVAVIKDPRNTAHIRDHLQK